MRVDALIAALQTLDPSLEVEPSYLNDYWSGSTGLFIDFNLQTIEEIAYLFGVETDVLKRPCPFCSVAIGKKCASKTGRETAYHWGRGWNSRRFGVEA